MKGNIAYLLMVIAALCPSGLSARGLNSVIERLYSMTDFYIPAEVSVQLPQGADINYNLDIYTTPAVNDTLSKADYLIEWIIPDNESSKGFTSYFDGHLYRYGDNRLTEYHFEWDSIPFLLGGGNSAVQHNAQFIGYTPVKIAETMSDFDKTEGWSYKFYEDTTFNGKTADVVLADYVRNGYLGKRLTLVFDPESSAPVYYESENNPTTISEQIVTVRYGTPKQISFPVAQESDLIDRYPEVFENFRESNFSIETMRDRDLVAFSLPTPTGERYSYEKGAGFIAPTVIAVFDPAVATSAETVSEIRKGAAMIPGASNLLFVSVSTDIDGTESVAGQLNPGEYLLMNGKSLARDTGINAYPTIIFVGRDGKVKDIVIGYNKNLLEIVIDKMALIN